MGIQLGVSAKPRLVGRSMALDEVWLYENRHDS